jgi:predicted ATPase
MAFHSDLPTFVRLLQMQLGPYLINIPLLYHETPELRDILALFHINFDEPKVALSTEELGARFQSLVETVFGVVGDVRPLAIFLDDIHFADQSLLDLVGCLANSRSRLVRP